MEQIFMSFLNTVPEHLRPFVSEIDAYLLDKDCKRSIKTAAKGYLVSYALPVSKKTLLNFVFRKGCVKARIYAAHVKEYEDLVSGFPDATKKEIAAALECKKLIGLTCSPTCPAGYQFVMDGVEYKKCRSMAFLPILNEENNPFIRKMIEAEVCCSMTDR